MSGYYAIQATVETTTADGWNGARQLPTFYLHANVQGIVHEDHAAIIAADIIDPTGMIGASGGKLHITTTKMGD